MLALADPDEAPSAIHPIRQWWRKRVVRSGWVARQLRVPPSFAISSAEQHTVAPRGNSFDLLLMRTEALGLEPGELKRIEAAVFDDLAAACSNCGRKDQCEQDLPYLSAGKVTPDWEEYCPNATTLKALTELPWFAGRRLHVE